MAIPGGDRDNGIFASINITPLTDIFLVLLIIFMVATAITIESAAHVELPRVDAPNQPQEARVVTVTYTAERQIFVNQRWVSEQGLGAAVSEALAQTPKKIVVFDGDPKVILGDAVRIVDIAKRAGAEQIALAVSGGGGGAAESNAAAPSAPAPSAPAPEAITPGTGPAPEPVAPASEP
jgi:biopolymer transport protein ExbD